MTRAPWSFERHFVHVDVHMCEGGWRGGVDGQPQVTVNYVELLELYDGSFSPHHMKCARNVLGEAM